MNRMIAAVCCALITSPTLAQPIEGSAVPAYGKTYPTDGAAQRPDPELDYRVVFDVTKAASDPAKPNRSLEAAARFLNLLAADGVRPAPGHIVAIVHGPATLAIASNDAYSRMTGQSVNPNLALIEQLRAAGAIVAVCSQAMQGQGLTTRAVAPGVRIDVSALTTLANLQLRGWALIPD